MKLLADNPNIWEDQSKASAIFKEKRALENIVNKFNYIQQGSIDANDLASLALSENDQESFNMALSELKTLVSDAQKFETEALFSGDTDTNNCFLEINAGAGGTESHDWASIMMRMYLRFAEKLGFKTEIVSLIDGEEAGIKSCSIKITGHLAHGWLKMESGVHRLVRISPFNAAGKRMTSFASCWVYPEIDDNIEVNIEEKDLRIDTYRASGAGGQHVNTTDSAVRITHIPTNIVVQCQSGRSQHKNKAEAMLMLKARIYNHELKKKNAETDKLNESKSENGWGHQIRSYVLQPYQMVKDLRTNHETSDTARVLDGGLHEFVSMALSGKNISNNR